MKRTYQKPEMQVQYFMNTSMLEASNSLQIQYNPDKVVDDDYDALWSVGTESIHKTKEGGHSWRVPTFFSSP